jgi:uncharacterized protein (TIGR00369 family)
VSPGELKQLVQYLKTSVRFASHIGLQIDEVEPGKAVFHLDIAEMHMNGAEMVHGGVHAALMDSAMAVALIAEGLRVATTQMSVHYLEPVKAGRLVCTGQVMHRARRTAIAEAKVQDEAGNLVAMASGSFRILDREQRPMPDAKGPSEQGMVFS